MERFGFDLSETSRLLCRDFDRRAAAVGVTRAQWRVLVRLSVKDGVRQVELAEALDVEPITLCRMIDRLEEAGLLERRRDEGDRRAWNIHLTPKAGPLIGELRKIGDTLQRDALSGIDKAEIASTLDVLARIRANLSKSGVSAARKVS